MANRVGVRLAMVAIVALAACGTDGHDPSDGGTTDLVVPDYSHAQIAFFHRANPDEGWTAIAGPIFWGDEVDVRVVGLPPGGVIAIDATSASYRSTASFHAQSDGTVSLATAAPDSGDYAGVDADGLFWSMRSDAKNETQDYDFTFAVRATGAKVAEATLTRYWSPPGAKLTQVTADGLHGVLVTPSTPGPHPALITFGGSEGGILSGQLAAEYYASLGYTCLGLAYFGAPGLPSQLDRIPLEYFGKAIAWMSARADVDPARIGVIGASRGGELALLLAATYPELKAAIAISPSGLVWGNTTATGAAWTRSGTDVPFMPSSGVGAEVSTDADGNLVYVSTPMFLADMQAASPSATAAATIAVEESNGAILLLAGEDDRLWPGCPLAKIAFDRLTSTGHAATHGDQFLCSKDAGHLIGQPDTSTMTSAESYVQSVGAWFALGGTPAGSAHAARASDTKIRAFLKRTLGP